ncbi:phenylalanine--tRNA ligase subunit alpha [Candidatus Microgenomates bacterium]|nr:phenylalanine--tRNA ligase subunit alpha [Candidatus Microgenomates bacterium]
MREQFLQVKNEALSLIIDADERKELEEIKIQFLGKKGKFTVLLKTISKLPLNVRPQLGVLANEVKTTIEEAFARRALELSRGAEEGDGAWFDVTLPGKKPKLGHLHPQTLVLDEIIDIFKSLGYQIADGPEIESDHYNFEMLNFPKDHPARDTQQTLNLKNLPDKEGQPLILRTHGSNMQGRIMEKVIPPCRVIYPGKVYRYEQTDASHGFEFWQVEGLALDKNITLTDLFGTFEYVLKQFFGQHTQVRFAAHNFPFTEPSTEVYVTCAVCRGKGCSFCKKSGWVEIAGAGMIHPNVLKAAGIDSKIWQGFAFGFGMSRMVTLKYQMDDLRLLTNPDLRILEQF